MAGRASASLARPSSVVPDKKRKISLSVSVPPHKVPRCLKLKPITMTNYAGAADEFVSWCGPKRMMLMPSQQVDRVLCLYIVDLIEDCGCINEASYALYG